MCESIDGETCACGDCAGEQDTCQSGLVCGVTNDAPYCTSEVCGNGVLDTDEQCDSTAPAGSNGLV